MKKNRKVILLAMLISTAIYISVVVYANSVDSGANVLYAAERYQPENPPPYCYQPEELGIVQVIEDTQNASWVHIEVDREKEPFPLQTEQPIFLYNGNFYKVLSLWVTPGLSEEIKQWQIHGGAAIGVGWAGTVIAGIVSWRKRG